MPTVRGQSGCTRHPRLRGVIRGVSRFEGVEGLFGRLMRRVRIAAAGAELGRKQPRDARGERRAAGRRYNLYGGHVQLRGDQVAGPQPRSRQQLERWQAVDHRRVREVTEEPLGELDCRAGVVGCQCEPRRSDKPIHTGALELGPRFLLASLVGP